MSRLLTRTTPLGKTDTRTCDPAGNMISASMPEAAVDLTYDARDQLLRIDRSNGVFSEYTYDPAGQVVSIVHFGSSGALSSQSYAYDAAGHRISHTTDIAQPLITQPLVNVFDEADRLLLSGATTYSYDDNGNLISANEPDGTTTYIWDARYDSSRR